LKVKVAQNIGSFISYFNMVGAQGTRTLDPLIKSQLASLKYQGFASKPLAFSGIANQKVTDRLQTANRAPLGLAVPKFNAPDSHLSCVSTKFKKLNRPVF
jgi:hypothetical protein